MGKQNYTGYKEFQKANFIAVDNQNNLGVVRTTLCQQAKNVGILLFGLDGKSETGRFNVNPKWLQAMFATAKMIGMVEAKKAENEQILKEFQGYHTPGNDKIVEELKKGNEFDYEKIKGYTLGTNDYRYQDLMRFKANNELYSNFKEDLEITDKTYGSTLNKNGNLITTKDLIVKSLEHFGFDEDEIKDVFDPKGLMIAPKLNALSKADSEEYDKEFNNFMDKYDSFKERKIKEILEKNYDDEELTDDKIEEDLAKDEEEAIKNKETDEAIEMAKAAKVNVEMEKRLNNSIVKKIPIIRWFSKEFRQERALLNKTNAILEKYPDGLNLKNFLKEQKVEDAYGLIDSVSNKKFEEDLKKMVSRDDSIIGNRKRLELDDLNNKKEILSEPVTNNKSIEKNKKLGE